MCRDQTFFGPKYQSIKFISVIDLSKQIVFLSHRTFSILFCHTNFKNEPVCHFIGYSKISIVLLKFHLMEMYKLICALNCSYLDIII